MSVLPTVAGHPAFRKGCSTGRRRMGTRRAAAPRGRPIEEHRPGPAKEKGRPGWTPPFRCSDHTFRTARGGPRRSARRERSYEPVRPASIAWRVSTIFWADSSRSMTMLSIRETK